MRYFVLFFLFHLVLPCFSQSSENQSLKKQDALVLRSLIEQWAQTRQLIYTEKTDWQNKREAIENLSSFYSKELNLLNEELQKTSHIAQSVDEDKQALESELQKFNEEKETLKQELSHVLPTLLTLSKSFPTPLREELSTPLKKLASLEALDDPRDTLKNILDVLNAANRFNRAFTLSTEILPIEGKKQVDILYLGLGRAYWAASKGKQAGWATPSPEGWQWHSSPKDASKIRLLIATHTKRTQPQSVQLPVSITPNAQ